jgi:ATP-dependent Clp protease protease subunit
MKATPMYRKILLSDEITSSSVEKIINTIFSINYDDDQKEEEYKDFKREPILLFINTNGGNAYDALALGDVIHQSKTPVYTIALGWCMSAGFLIYLFGHKKFVGYNSTLMYHDVSMGMKGKSEYIKQELSEMKRIADIMNTIIVSNSKVELKDLQDYINRKAEWYIEAVRALDLHLADGYYDSDKI